MVPVTLMIASEEDLRLRLTGYSAKEIRRYRVARMLQEAYEQGCVLNFADVSHLIGVSAGKIGKDVNAYLTCEIIYCQNRDKNRGGEGASA